MFNCSDNYWNKLPKNSFLKEFFELSDQEQRIYYSELSFFRKKLVDVYKDDPKRIEEKKKRKAEAENQKEIQQLLEPFHDIDPSLFSVKSEKSEQFNMFYSILLSSRNISLIVHAAGSNKSHSKSIEHRIEKIESRLIDLYIQAGLDLQAIATVRTSKLPKEILTPEEYVNRYKPVWIKLLQRHNMPDTTIKKLTPKLKSIFKNALEVQRGGMSCMSINSIELMANKSTEEPYTTLLKEVEQQYQDAGLPNPNHFENLYHNVKSIGKDPKENEVISKDEICKIFMDGFNSPNTEKQ